MAGRKTASIPAWQRASTEDPPPKQSADNNTIAPAEESSPQEPRDVLLDQARQFLEDPSINNASPERKSAFLTQKGLREDEIEQLLSAQPSTTEQTASDSSTDTQELKTIHESSNDNQHPSARENAPSSSSSAPFNASSTSPSKQPPIITYPEFLLQAQKPPPLITFQRLLYTFYLCASLGATFYGTNKFLVTPLLASLTAARHSFFESTRSNLQTLNNKLSSTVSRVPDLPTGKPTSSSTDKDQDAEDETSSIASDPTELFHRDIATQTTPSIPQSPVSGTLADPSQSPSLPVAAAAPSAESQATSLTTLTTHLRDLLASTSEPASFDSYSNNDSITHNSTQTLSDSLESLKSYLDTLRYGGGGVGSNGTSASTSTNAIAYDRSFTSIYDFTERDRDRKNRAGGGGGGAGEDDEVAKFKAEIRSLKGTLLSARNFPSAPQR